MSEQFHIVARCAGNGQVKDRCVDTLKVNVPPDEDPDEYLRQHLPELAEETLGEGGYTWWQVWEYDTLIAASENAPTTISLAPGPDGKPRLPVGEIQVD